MSRRLTPAQQLEDLKRANIASDFCLAGTKTRIKIADNYCITDDEELKIILGKCADIALAAYKAYKVTLTAINAQMPALTFPNQQEGALI